jgi:hypothetical protein
MLLDDVRARQRKLAAEPFSVARSLRSPYRQLGQEHLSFILNNVADLWREVL